MASKTADCSIPSCRVMWVVSVITLAPVVGLLLWPAVNADAENLTDESVVFTGCVPLNQSDAGTKNLTDDESVVFTGCVPVGKLKDVIEAIQVKQLSQDAVYMGSATRYVMMPPTESSTLSPDAVYMGSATLAGLAIFGSSILIRINDVINSKIRRLQIGVIMLIIGPYTLAIVHVIFMFTYNPEDGLLLVTIASLVLIAVTVAGYFSVESGRANEQTGHHKPIR